MTQLAPKEELPIPSAIALWIMAALMLFGEAVHLWYCYKLAKHKWKVR